MDMLYPNIYYKNNRGHKTYITIWSNHENKLKLRDQDDFWYNPNGIYGGGRAEYEESINPSNLYYPL